MKIEAAVAALTVTAVETIALVVAVGTADGDGRQQQKLRGQATINKLGQAAAVAAVTAAVPVAIFAARLQWKAGEQWSI